MRTAFVLSGGAALGAAQAGMLRGLYERGAVPDLMVGASVGGRHAAFAATRPQTPATADTLAATLVAWRAAGFEPAIAGYSSDFALTAALVARRGAVALIPRMALRQPDGVVALPLSEPKVERGVCAATRAGSVRLQAVAALLGALRRAAAPA